MAKRQSGTESDQLLKKQKAEDKSDEEKAILKQLSEYQSQLDKLDAECASEQMSIQQKFDKMKADGPLPKRKAAISKIPHFWSKVFQAHPELCEFVADPEALELVEHLEDIDIQDSLDVHGSYKCSFKFRENPFFSKPLTLTRNLQCTEQGTEELTTNLKDIDFKQEKELSKKLSKCLKDGFDAESDIIPNVLHLFLEDDVVEVDFNEAIRKDIFIDPTVFYERAEFGDSDTEPQE
eukprot:Platyproteum_vivax@DN3229_c0_g1_i1.p1